MRGDSGLRSGNSLLVSRPESTALGIQFPWPLQGSWSSPQTSLSYVGLFQCLANMSRGVRDQRPRSSLGGTSWACGGCKARCWALSAICCALCESGQMTCYSATPPVQLLRSHDGVGTTEGPSTLTCVHPFTSDLSHSQKEGPTELCFWHP